MKKNIHYFTTLLFSATALSLSTINANAAQNAADDLFANFKNKPATQNATPAPAPKADVVEKPKAAPVKPAPATAVDALFGGFVNESERNATPEELADKKAAANLFKNTSEEEIVDVTSAEIAEIVVEEAPEEPSTEPVAEAKPASREDSNLFFIGVENLKERSDKGDADAQYTLASYFYTGTIVPKNIDLAIEYFQKSADGGSADGAYNLAMLYQHGIAKADNKNDLIFKYLKKSANDNVNAMFNLGVCYINEIGTKRDLIRAYYCFAKSERDVKEAYEALMQIIRSQDDAFIEQAEAFLNTTDKI